uniref:Uncharacterized protein n=1 Tax=Arion vulgaris TaxID=1028688 RepID=A0A0B7ARN9_9EUPU
MQPQLKYATQKQLHTVSVLLGRTKTANLCHVLSYESKDQMQQLSQEHIAIHDLKNF